MVEVILLMTEEILVLIRNAWNRSYCRTLKVRHRLWRRLHKWYKSGADPGFQVRGGALKKIAPSGGRRENLWGISCEKSPFYANNHIFPILGGGGLPPPESAPVNGIFWCWICGMWGGCLDCICGKCWYDIWWGRWNGTWINSYIFVGLTVGSSIRGNSGWVKSG